MYIWGKNLFFNVQWYGFAEVTDWSTEDTYHWHRAGVGELFWGGLRATSVFQNSMEGLVGKAVCPQRAWPLPCPMYPSTLYPIFPPTPLPCPPIMPPRALVAWQAEAVGEGLRAQGTGRMVLWAIVCPPSIGDGYLSAISLGMIPLPLIKIAEHK